MKTLSIQQPWAYLIAAGILDVENRNWGPEKMPKRILIHATPKSFITIEDSYPLEWAQIIKNEQIFGNLPDISDMPVNAIIGYVTLKKVEKKPGSFSLKPENEFYWHYKDAHIFDKPILGVKNKLHLWDYDLDESKLPPAHTIKRATVTITDDYVNIPVTENILLGLTPNDVFTIELTPFLDLLFLPNSYKLKPFKTVTFRCKKKQRTFYLGPKTGLYKVNKDNEDFYYSHHYWWDDTEPRRIIRFILGKES